MSESASHTSGFEAVIGLQEVKAVIDEKIVLPSWYPHLLALHTVPPWVMLYGPPGCGKTMLLRALADRVHCPSQFANMLEVLAQQPGLANPILASLFEEARKLPLSLLLLDEIDAACHPVLLSELQSLLEDSKSSTSSANAKSNVMVVAVTNDPASIPQEILKHFPHRCYLGLPDADARAQILKSALQEVAVSLSEGEYQDCGVLGAELTGADIVAYARHAALEPIRECTHATRFRWISEGVLVPAAPTDPEGFDANFTDLPDFSKVRPRPLTKVTLACIPSFSVSHQSIA